MSVAKAADRLSFQEANELIRVHRDPSLSEHGAGGGGGAGNRWWYMSTRPAWVPGTDLPWEKVEIEYGYVHKATYGAHVYIMAGAAVLRAIAEQRGSPSILEEDIPRLGLHSIQGCFTAKGSGDRPFLLEVTQISSGRSFATWFVKARQPTTPSTLPSAHSTFELSDAHKPLGPVCFTSIISLKNPESSPIDNQQLSAQTRHASLLSSRRPTSWPPCPSVDIDWIAQLFPNNGAGTFPIIDIRKVDMSAYNAALPEASRKEILLYKLLKPLPYDTPDEIDLHALVHAYAADRNGLLMLCNNFGMGFRMQAAATLSWSFYLHVDPERAIVRESADPEGGWWVLEDEFTRGAAGRGFIVGRIWSPEGVHVATAVQDGIARAMPGDSKM